MGECIFLYFQTGLELVTSPHPKKKTIIIILTLESTQEDKRESSLLIRQQ